MRAAPAFAAKRRRAANFLPAQAAFDFAVAWRVQFFLEPVCNFFRTRRSLFVWLVADGWC
jgi:hypothetical protein